MNKLEQGWEDGFGEKLQGYGTENEQNYGVFGDSLINEDKMQEKYYTDNEIDCGNMGDKVMVNGKETVIVDDERIDYGLERFDNPFTQEEINAFQTKIM